MKKRVKRPGLFEQIREVVKQIPRGKVATYGQIAKAIGLRDARKVGWAMWGNQDPEIPCHRVVKAGGYLAEKYSLGGWKEQARRLKEDGVRVSDKNRVDMDKHGWE
jgi:methylated-DNA-protein-cysteine methyltransferase-like protein